MFHRARYVAVALSLAVPALAAARADGPPAGGTLATIDLARTFATRAPWRLVVTQGPAAIDPMGDPDEKVPGVVRLCLSRDGGRACDPALLGMLRQGAGDDNFAEPHYLVRADIVHPRAGLPLLLVQAASNHAGNGDQRVGTVALAYDRAADRFVAAYAKQVNRNNNQEVRYIASGRLQGAIVSAEPTRDAPFGFWITVNRLSAGGSYRPVLHYRSATRYNDGNPLKVIDSEMPNIQRQLGLWRAGQPLPLPAGGCPRPRLTGMELWCR